MNLMIHTIQPGDRVTMVGPDGQLSDQFILAEVPILRRDAVWLYRENDAPIVVDRTYGLDSTFVLHSRRPPQVGRRRANP